MSGFGCYMTALIQGYTDQDKAINLKDIDFTTSKSFNINTLIVISILTLIYGFFW